MKDLTNEQAIEILNELFGENIKPKFYTQLENAGKHGDNSFVISNSEDTNVEVLVEWNNEKDVLVYSINEDYESE
ncbi:hypothetical protein ACFQ3N_09480 [Virgibacillus byunsanensis]|uniref:Uncharacterized protein n=1 Tax=Virgibacillus byunsanensis TaxID=570945 RepID=A0ABW3LKP8_9BACI